MVVQQETYPSARNTALFIAVSVEHIHHYHHIKHFLYLKCFSSVLCGDKVQRLECRL